MLSYPQKIHYRALILGIYMASFKYLTAKANKKQHLDFCIIKTFTNSYCGMILFSLCSIYHIILLKEFQILIKFENAK